MRLRHGAIPCDKRRRRRNGGNARSRVAMACASRERSPCRRAATGATVRARISACQYLDRFKTGKFV
ncbi:hypothetical protein LC55x_4065 [Lysobacter capsici]|uniref:Uncharacterized protein n=1 Tax=Lysobacter capsici AZ78 TaxID=1444315 RepID=A0A108UDF3_9GAMM|nr:hypothetical protein LC55x_4065 [Lysobacter capsici]KWS06904.1 hypothetical protein AZ78_4464 [Lysobacter capsici AZ78]